MFRRILWFVPILLMAGYAFWGLEWTDYQKGYNQALKDLKTAQQDAETARQWGDKILNGVEQLGIDPNSANPDQPQDWNQGYRQALRDFMARQTNRRE